MKKKILLLVVLASFSTLSQAEKNTAGFDQSKLSLGASYNGVFSIRGDYDISDMAKAPVKARIGYDRYTVDASRGNNGYSWAYNVLYGGAYYDFNKQVKLNEKVHPFLGLGLDFGTASCAGGCNGVAFVGLYLMGGVQYDLQKNLNVEASFNGWGGLSLGGNYKF